MLILIAIEGPDKGRVFELPGTSAAVLGRAGDRVPLTDPHCADRHARLVHNGDAWHLTPYAVGRVTRLNGRPIGERAPIRAGDSIRLGKTTLAAAILENSAAERQALLGPDTTVSPVPPPRRRLGRAVVLAAATLTAAAVATAVTISLLPPAPRLPTPTAHVQPPPILPASPAVAPLPPWPVTGSPTAVADPPPLTEPATATNALAARVQALATDLQQARAKLSELEERVIDAPPPVVDVATDPTLDDGLTRTERAYRQAFETGKPVRLGAGLVDPVTGQPVAGRVIDPRTARAAGITTWQQWCLVDELAERMRLQRAASRHVATRRGPDDVLTVPRTEAVYHASPAPPETASTPQRSPDPASDPTPDPATPPR